MLKASEILDKYIESNKYTRQDYYYLHNVEHEPLDDVDKIPESKSIVSLRKKNIQIKCKILYLFMN